MPSAAKPAKAPEAPKGGKGKQWAWLLVALVIIVGLIYFLGKGESAHAPADGAALEEESGAMEKTSVGPSLSWEFAPAGGDSATGAPLTKVMLVVNGESRDLGTATGSCSIVDGSGTTWSLMEGEITGTICYFAGAGEEYGVFYDAGAYVVKKGSVEEGSAEVAGSRGGYEALFTI